MKTVNPRDLLFDQLLDLHSVESQLVVSLPRIVERTTYPPLARCLAQHAAETHSQLKVVASILGEYGIETGEDECEAIAGLITGGDAHLDAVEVRETRDLMIIAHCLRIEHYEIAAYGITVRLAYRVGLKEARWLSTILEEEKAQCNKLEEFEPILYERTNSSNHLSAQST